VSWVTQAWHDGELAGQRLGSYQIVEPLGSGSTGIVLKALQPALRRHVAIKVLSSALLQHPQNRERFQAEAEVIARLEHPNILPIYDYGLEGDISYLVMPLVGGGTLREWLTPQVTLDRALQVLSRVLDALEYAHTFQPSIVHRTVKPSNILMTEGDWPMLADFGLASVVEASHSLAAADRRTRAPSYASPEQHDGAPADRRTDVYAVGLILFEMLTGQHPYGGQMPPATRRGEVPSPRDLKPEMPSYWTPIVRRSLAWAPADRYPTAAAMNHDVQTMLKELRSHTGTRMALDQEGASRLHDNAARALAEGDWARVMDICRLILAADPAHPDAVSMLTEAHTALRRTLQLQAGYRATPAPATLTVRQGPDVGTVYPCEARICTIGRAADNSIQFDVNTMSRRHCQIRWTDGVYNLDDLGSSNGAYHNGTEIGSVELASGDVIQAGGIVLEFRVDLHARRTGTG